MSSQSDDGIGNGFAFEQVEAEYNLVVESVEDFVNGEGEFSDREEADEWVIEWDDSSRETGMGGIAWFAHEFDPDAEVTPVE